MNPKSISRKSFLKVASTAALGGVAAACSRVAPPSPTEQIMNETSTPSPTAPPEPTEAPQVEVRLNGERADVWAWQAVVSGSVENQPQDSEIILEVNGEETGVEREGDNFSAAVSLREGENRIKAECRGANNQILSSSSLIYTVPLKKQPKAVIQPEIQDGKLILTGIASQPVYEEGPQIINHIWRARPGNPAPVLIDGIAGLGEREFSGEASGESITLTLPEVEGEYYFSLTVFDEEGHADTGATYVEVRDGQIRIPNYDVEGPAWVESAIVYGVIPRNFGSEGFMSIIEKLDYLQDLGINALWLAPINLSPPGDYGYAVMDYFDLGPRYGTKEEFHRMVQEAHARGIRVLMDLVPNHSSAKHPYFETQLREGRGSHYYDYYDRDGSGNYTYYFDWEHLPNLNYNNPEVERWMIEASAYWVREFDIDGYRVDVAWGVKERKPEFWPLWRRELKRIKPDLLLLAEASARDPFYFGNGFDAAYDWTSQLGHWAWERVWEAEEILTFNLNSALTNQGRGYDPDALIFRFINNNDTGTRFITTHGLEMTRVATAMLLTLPGIPCVYTGDEVGEAFRPYFDPLPLIWEDQYGLRDYHKQLITLRAETPSLRSRHWTILDLEPHQQVYGYARHLDQGQEPVLVLLNFFETEAETEIQLPEELASLRRKSSWTDLITGEPISARSADSLTVTVPGLGALILV